MVKIHSWKYLAPKAIHPQSNTNFPYHSISVGSTDHHPLFIRINTVNHWIMRVFPLQYTWWSTNKTMETSAQWQVNQKWLVQGFSYFNSLGHHDTHHLIMDSFLFAEVVSHIVGSICISITPLKKLKQARKEWHFWCHRKCYDKETNELVVCQAYQLIKCL